jgi:ribosomal protein L29
VADTVEELEKRISDLKKRLPAHSPKPAMIRELEELEEQLANLVSRAKAGTEEAPEGPV